MSIKLKMKVSVGLVTKPALSASVNNHQTAGSLIQDQPVMCDNEKLFIEM